jgi:hypothetical protein
MLGNNQIASLPETLIASLPLLRELWLNGNRLAKLPALCWPKSGACTRARACVVMVCAQMRVIDRHTSCFGGFARVEQQTATRAQLDCTVSRARADRSVVESHCEYDKRVKCVHGAHWLMCVHVDSVTERRVCTTDRSASAAVGAQQVRIAPMLSRTLCDVIACAQTD